MKKEIYTKTVDLLLKILPLALKDDRFALKGGTAINLFHRNFPRMSVDIDLCYLPLENRETTFKNMHSILKQIKEDLENNLGLNVSAGHNLDGKKETKLVASQDGIEVKIEPNYILRSTLFPAKIITLATNAEDEFKRSVKARCLSPADLYGGKICAALDRQHPRDLFDIKFLFENEGITTEVKDSFVFYLISHNRPINELLNPNLKNITQEYKEEFREITHIEVSLDALLKAREDLVNVIKKSLTENDRKFLISFVSNNPEWELVRDGKIQDFPSVKWKLLNQAKMTATKRQEYVNNLKKIFEN